MSEDHGFMDLRQAVTRIRELTASLGLLRQAVTEVCDYHEARGGAQWACRHLRAALAGKRLPIPERTKLGPEGSN